ncbi:MAG: glycosyltransferase family 2 protein [Thermoguttaceae bacterium]|nr:glycosyltransferase family 2 protein [Thermoguttaceae bacterium]
MTDSAASVINAESFEDAGLFALQKSKTDLVNPSLIITTYNWPQALRLSVKSVWTQTILPKEIVIADDGSNDNTRETIDLLRKQSPIPITHVWQPDEGFQLSKIRNRGIAAASSEYIIFIDGDCILEKNFIEDHIYYAQVGRSVSGSRIKLTPSASAKFLASESFNKPYVLSPKIRFGYNLSAIRNRWLCNRTIVEIANYQPKVKMYGSNMAFWKSDAIRINGFDEEYTAWGWEDHDFSFRLRRSGVPLKCIRFAALQYHLYHQKQSHDNNNTAELFKRCVDQRRVRAEKGLDQYL